MRAESMTGLASGYPKAQECQRPVMLSRNLFRSEKLSGKPKNCLTATYDYRPRAVGGSAGGCGLLLFGCSSPDLADLSLT